MKARTEQTPSPSPAQRKLPSPHLGSGQSALESPPPGEPITKAGNKHHGPVGQKPGLLEKWPHAGQCQRVPTTECRKTRGKYDT